MNCTIKNARGLLAVAAAILIAGCTSGPEPGPDSYLDTIVSARAEKDRLFREDSESPIPASKRDTLLPLIYYAPDPDYLVPAILRPSPYEPAMEMPTSTGKIRPYRRAGSLEFTLKGQAMKLTAFTEGGPGDVDRLFVPFTDLTTGTETYAAGRYLDLVRTKTGIYEVDFNRAYNPFCYFDARFDCPYPPAENRLKVAIKAGERLPVP